MKKLFAILLSLTMLVCFMPTMAFAAEGTAGTTDVASIETQGYATLQAAVTAATDGQTIEVLNNSDGSITIPEGKNIIIN